jgi:fatty-acid desaturase
MSVCLHRYFAHCAFATSRPVAFVLEFFLCLSTLCEQQGPLWWASMQTLHHRFCDQPRDPHSLSQTNFLYAWIGWTYYEFATDFGHVPKLFMHPELIFINNFDFIPKLVASTMVYHMAGTVRLFYWLVVPCFTSCLATLYFNVKNHPERPPGKANMHYTSIDTTSSNTGAFREFRTHGYIE